MLEQDRKQPGLERRQFLLVALLGSLSALIAQSAVALVEFFRPRIEVGSFGSRILAGRAAEFPPGSVRHVRAGQFYVTHIEGDGLLALWHRCTHLGCTVPWREDEGQFHCPCHSSLFDLKGEVLGGPAPRPLDRFAIEIKDGEVIVDTGQPLDREAYDSSQAAPV